jgi:hypothetical protein
MKEPVERYRGRLRITSGRGGAQRLRPLLTATQSRHPDRCRTHDHDGDWIRGMTDYGISAAIGSNRQ